MLRVAQGTLRTRPHAWHWMYVPGGSDFGGAITGSVPPPTLTRCAAPEGPPQNLYAMFARSAVSFFFMVTDAGLFL